MSSPEDTWADALLALRLLARDPGLGGLVLRARAGPVRDVYLRLAERLLGPCLRIGPSVTDQALFGGLDLSATLAKGQLVQEQGLLERPEALMLTSAERAVPRLAAHLALALDRGQGRVLIAVDEGCDPDETVPPALSERLAFHVDLTEVPLSAAQADDPVRSDGAQAAQADDTMTLIAGTALQFGIDSLRACVFAHRAARGHAALSGRVGVTYADLETACRLAFAHRATQFPAPEPEEPETPPPPPDQSEEVLTIPDEMLLEAVRAMLPEDLLERLAARRARQGKGSGSGAAKRGNRRGRPLPSRPGRLADGARIDIVATLRAAAPWQTIRHTASGRTGLHIRAADIHLRRFEEKTDRLLVFVVDASGSAALARLAEAKGAVELLLAQAYARRDHVSLVAFRGTAAEVLLPPTRSLVQTKRRLAGLPGGGGTPLAAGLQEGLAQALLARRRGLTPTLILLTDGRANIALDGAADREQAGADAMTMAALVRAEAIDALVIDTGNRPEQALKALSQTLNGTYLPLPRADAERLSAAVASVLET
jgi:magnesium chelatase subunit D